MLVLPQMVEMRWSTSNKKRYENFGYSFTKYNDTFFVDVRHLSDSNRTEIELICDYCLEEGIKRIYKNSYHIYRQSLDLEIVKDCCDDCKNKKLSEIKSKKTSEKFIKRLEKENYKLIQNDYYKNKTITFLCPQEHLWIANIQSLTHDKRCRACKYIELADNQRRDIREVFQIFANEGCTLLSTSYKNSKQILDYRCICGRKAKKSLTNFLKSKYCRKCIANNQSGENSPSWNPNLTNEERIIQRKYKEYGEWVKGVLIRDNYTCQCCGKRGNGTLNAHHLDSYDWCDGKRTDLNNGITLCENCHRLDKDSFHKIYGFGKNTKEQFEEWIIYKINKNSLFHEADDNQASFLF